MTVPSLDMRERDMVPVLEAMVGGFVTKRVCDRMYRECKEERIARTLNRLTARREAVIAELGAL
jgi:hypothetical protein